MLYAVHQPHYLPYLGYLAKVDCVDTFVFLEDVQFVKREFQNRNKIKTPQGAQWLTVPVKGEYKARISEMLPDHEKDWARQHVETLRRNYSKAPFIDELDGFAKVVVQSYPNLAELGMATTRFFLERFGIHTPVQGMKDFKNLPEDPNLRIITIGQQLNADVYLAGIGGKNYMDLDLFAREGVHVEFFDFHPEPYPQQNADFLPYMGAIDLLLNAGPDGFDKYVRPTLKGD